MRQTNRILIFVFVMSLLAIAQDTTQGDTTSAIIAREHAWIENEMRNDNNALDLIFDNALVYIEYGKVLTKSDYLAKIRLAPSHPSEQITLEGSTVRAFGTTAISIGVYQEKMTVKGKLIRKRWRYVDTWVFKEGSWKLVAAVSSPITQP